jgi:hypothetical protein
MIDSDIAKLIIQLEKILKKDKRFKRNHDNKYRSYIKQLYKTSLYNQTPIDLTSLIQNDNLIYIKYINMEMDKIKKTLTKIIGP